MSRQEKPDQSPEAFKQYFESIGISVTGDKVFGFIDEAMRSPFEAPTEENTRAAAALLFEMVQAAKYGEKWEPYKKRIGLKRVKAKRFDPELVTIDDDAFGIVLAYTKGQITHKKAKALFSEKVCPASDRMIETWIAEIKPRAVKLVAFEQEITATKPT